MSFFFIMMKWDTHYGDIIYPVFNFCFCAQIKYLIYKNTKVKCFHKDIKLGSDIILNVFCLTSVVLDKSSHVMQIQYEDNLPDCGIMVSKLI